MGNIATLMVKIGADTSGLTAGLNTAETSTKKLVSSLGKLVAAGAVAAGGMLTMGLMGASSMEQYRNTLDTVMKDTKKAAKTFKWAVDFANKTPFETDSVVEATVRLASYGLEAEKVLPSVGNMAAVMNKDIMQAVEAVADAQTGELERMKEFGITKQMIVDGNCNINRLLVICGALRGSPLGLAIGVNLCSIRNFNFFRSVLADQRSPAS